MDYASAVERLTFHCGTNPDIDDPRWAAGFLQTLRPYRGRLDTDAMDGVLACVDAVAGHLTTADSLDRAVINSLWGINHYARSWGLHPDGMLRRNGLISDTDRKTLSDWLDDFADRIAMMLDGGANSNRDA
jgi:hypothetical protein